MAFQMTTTLDRRYTIYSVSCHSSNGIFIAHILFIVNYVAPFKVFSSLLKLDFPNKLSTKEPIGGCWNVETFEFICSIIGASEV